MKRNRGFTLIEILLVSVMTSVLAIAVFHAFSNGLKIWSKGNRLVVESDISIFFDKIATDLRNVPIISTIKFKGISSQISFPTSTGQIGAVEYRYDAAEKKVFRRVADYGQANKGLWDEPREAAINIDGFTLRYYFRDGIKEQIKTQTDEGIPSGVMVDIQFSDAGKERHMRRFFIIPVGGGL